MEADRMQRIATQIIIMIIKGYQALVSPFLPPSCRFTPSCSSYALTSIGRFGPVRGGMLALRRILRCHPWNLGGYDPVPPGVERE